MDLNAAQFTDLLRLPGVGPTAAAAIVAHRQEGGAFKNIDDLSAVKGIGPATLKKIRPLLAVGPAGPKNQRDRVRVP
jgi:competence protein ComEA